MTRRVWGGRRSGGYFPGFPNEDKVIAVLRSGCPRSNLPCVSLSQAVVAARNSAAWRGLSVSATANAASQVRVRSSSIFSQVPVAFSRPPLFSSHSISTTLAQLSLFTGSRREGGGRVSCNHAARRRCGAGAHACCQGGVQGEWPGLSPQAEGEMWWFGSISLTLTVSFLGPVPAGCLCSGGVPGAPPE